MPEHFRPQATKSQTLVERLLNNFALGLCAFVVTIPVYPDLKFS
jgi:hypothetical protein